MEDIKEKRKSKIQFGFRRFLFLTGCALLTFLDGLHLYWGNLAVYVYSYFLMQVYMEPVNQGPWVVATFLASKLFGMISLEGLEKCVFKKWTPVVAILSANLGLFLSYVSVQCSLELLVVTFCIFGFGTGIFQFWTLKEIVETTPKKDLGVLTAIPHASTYFGAVVANQILTMYINPLNLSPNVEIGGFKYFSQKEIVDKVPTVFLLLGGFTLGFELVGVFLVKVFEDDNNNLNDRNAKQSQLLEKEIQTYASFTIESKNGNCESSNNSHLNNENYTSSDKNSVNMHLENMQSNLEQNSSNVSHSDVYKKDEMSSQLGAKQYTMREVLKSPVFYLMCFSRSFHELALILVFTYYKTFGQLWINDDHFHAKIGMASAICCCCGRFISGVFYDRIGWKNTILLATFLQFFMLIWYYFTAMTSRWLFLVFNTLMPTLSQVLLAAAFPLTILVFGKTNAMTTVSLIRLTTIMQNLVSPLVVQAELYYLGMFYSFLTAGVGIIITFFLLLFFFPEV